MSDHRAASDHDSRIGQRVRARRLEIGLSQERLAEKLGLTFQQIQKYERGVNRVAASRLWEIAKALNVDVRWFFDAPDEAPTANAVAASLATPEGVELQRMFATIKTPVVRKRVVDLVSAVVGEHAAQ